MGEAETARALARDWRTADVSEADRAMLGYAVKLTRAPASVGAADVEGLRALGFDETAILDICQVTAYYNYVNRLADGLGVELEAFWTEEELTMTAEEFEARTGHPPVPQAEAADPAAPGRGEGGAGPSRLDRPPVPPEDPE